MGTVSLRGQRFTLPMRNALRKEVFPIDVSFTRWESSQELLSDQSIVVRQGKEWHVKLHEMVRMVVNVRNECSKFLVSQSTITTTHCQTAASPKSLMMSMTTVPPTPPEYAKFDGKLTNDFLGTLPASSSDTSAEAYKSRSLGVRFVAEGIYDLLVEVTEVNEDGYPLPSLEKNMTAQMVKVIVTEKD